MQPDFADQIRACPSLPSLPAVAVEVLELTSHDDVEVPMIAKVVQNDPALSGKLLKTVNSSFYARSSKVSTLQQAVVIMGVQSVRTVVLGFTLVGSMSRMQSRGFKHLDYWRRSVHAAAAAKLIAAQAKIVQQEEAFFAALLSDIGMLAMDQVVGEPYSEAYARSASHHELLGHERALCEATHAEVAGVLVDSWNLPPVLAEPVRYHHDPDACPDPGLLPIARVVSLANECADVFCDADPANAITTVRAHAREWFEMDDTACDALLAELGKKASEVAGLLELKLGRFTSFEDVLRKANERLVELNLRTQQQAEELAVRAAAFEQAAITDGLTKLLNRAELDRRLAKAMATLLPLNKPVSLLMMDADKFKSINDTHGHDAGDTVLRWLAQQIQIDLPPGGICARYGGEEMVVVLPEADRAAAVRAAEAIRARIAASPVVMEDLALRVTVSIGVATCDLDSPLKQGSHLLKAADLAMYAAKQAGRNRVKVFTLPARKKAA